MALALEETAVMEHLIAIAKAYSATTVFPADVCAATSTECPAWSGLGSAMRPHCPVNAVLVRACLQLLRLCP